MELINSNWEVKAANYEQGSLAMEHCHCKSNRISTEILIALGKMKVTYTANSSNLANVQAI